MKCILNSQQIQTMVLHQLEEKWAFKSGGGGYSPSIDIAAIDAVLGRLENCLNCVNFPYCQQGDDVVFRFEHSVQYAIFLYILSNEVYKRGDQETAGYIYYLNKIMNCVEWFYAVELPVHFWAEHPLGSVLGRAQYGDCFFLYQGCTVGGNRKGNRLYYPVIGDYVTMYSDSKILGKCHVGNHVIMAANSYIIDMDIPDYSVVFGQPPNVVIKHGMEERIESLERELWLPFMPLL